jgi:choline/glycine/proline betaine transport protein
MIAGRSKQIKAELSNHNIQSVIKEYEDPQRVEIVITYDRVNDFVYGVKNQIKEVSEQFLAEKN